MSTERRALIAKKACIRCSTQKRRCDKAIPDCGLCTRLRQTCKYEPSSGPTPSPSPRPEIFLGSVAFTPSHLKDAIIQKFGPITPEDTFSAYCRAIEPWFPIISIPRLRSRLPLAWDEVSLDIALLCLSIILLTTTPRSSPENDNDRSEFKSLYCHTKNWISSTETLGLNSFQIVQSRILVTLFEVAHGLYPAAYISIGATTRAADALAVHPGADASSSHTTDDETKRQDSILTWCGILILDRYIAVDSGPHPSLTRSRSQTLHDLLKSTLCLTNLHHQNRTNPICRLARLFEASSLLDKIHTTLNSPTAEHAFNMEELILTFQTLINLQTILNEEIGDGIHLYAGGLSLCNTFGFVDGAILLASENGSKLPLIAGVAENCNFIATESLISVLSTITSTVEPFTLGTQSIDFNFLPPFVTFLVYKAAAILTERLFMDSDSNEGLRKLRILRNFLRIVGERWLGCERYLKLLNEDTTPRILKAIEQG
ncbi:hypothetical protein V1520DRAFT_328417 [Lipomyces starkeyi]|uniref:Zn(2)-C6 fungal-type domain-containing protein n=1 Tax=Lipomyces starkeyi NRRL Y-11557 TaxID=675824 RepID=A0A1E3Q5W2_LIPST|nr:hypothetical protein LIPSTDRAFT_63196 [Lipomyces starkeyi NRRL Y-11557]